MPELRYFSDQEFRCKCGNCDLGVENMNLDLLISLDEARHLAGVPFKITSAMRCPDHNAAVGGVPSSSHLTGYAVDIAVGDDAIRFKVLDSLLTVGFNRVGISDGFIHVDNDPGKNSRRIWTY